MRDVVFKAVDILVARRGEAHEEPIRIQSDCIRVTAHERVYRSIRVPLLYDTPPRVFFTGYVTGS